MQGVPGSNPRLDNDFSFYALLSLLKASGASGASTASRMASKTPYMTNKCPMDFKYVINTYLFYKVAVV